MISMSPGEYIDSFLKEHSSNYNASRRQLSLETKIPLLVLCDIIANKKPIDINIAIALSKSDMLGRSVDSWMMMQHAYDGADRLCFFKREQLFDLQYTQGIHTEKNIPAIYQLPRRERVTYTCLYISARLKELIIANSAIDPCVDIIRCTLATASSMNLELYAHAYNKDWIREDKLAKSIETYRKLPNSKVELINEFINHNGLYAAGIEACYNLDSADIHGNIKSGIKGVFNTAIVYYELFGTMPLIRAIDEANSKEKFIFNC